MCGEEFSFDKRDRRAIPADPVAADTLADRVRALAEEMSAANLAGTHGQIARYYAARLRALLTEEPTHE